MKITYAHKYVRKYTSLASALSVLTRSQISLLDPANWDDSNDSYFLRSYSVSKNIPRLFASCFTQATETYHHWKVFTQGIDGVCLEFNRQALESSIRADDNLRCGPMEYMLIRELEELRFDEVDRLPFVKRRGFSDEREWRVLAEGKEPLATFYPLSFQLSAINRIILNPWMPDPLVADLRAMLKALPGLTSTTVSSSRLINSKQWKEAGRSVCLLD